MTDWHAHVTVATVVEREGRFLLAEEWAGSDLVLNQPAGHLEAGETLQHAAVRETLEETGWTVDLQGVVGVALYTAPANGVTYHRTTFFAQALHHNPAQKLDDGIQQAVWMSVEELRDAGTRLRSPLVLAAVEHYLNGHRYPLQMIYAP